MIKNRQIFSKIWEQVDSPDILIFSGPRQSGKTTLLQMVAQKLKTEKNIFDAQLHFFDLENVEDLAVWSNQSLSVGILPLGDMKNRHFVFIDEFQKSKNIGSILKFLHDHHSNFKFLITGSASWYLNIDESMAGRKRVFEIWPLSFEEYLDFRDFNKIKDYYRIISEDNSSVSDSIIQTVNKELLNFLTFGGYPRVVLSESKEEKIKNLAELVNSYLLRDIQLWNYAANPLQVKQLLTILASQVGSLLETSSLCSNAGLGRSALLNRLELLQNTFILFLSRPYFTNKIKELIKNPKIYLVDNGLRNSLLQNFSLSPKTTDFGMVAENFAVTEIRKNIGTLGQIFYWRTKQGQEVDIVLKQENDIIPIEIKSGIEKQIPSNLKSFIAQYHPKVAFVLNWSINKIVEFEGCKVYFRPIWYAAKTWGSF